MLLKDFVKTFDFNKPDWDNLPNDWPKPNTTGLTSEEVGKLAGIKTFWLLAKPEKPEQKSRTWTDPEGYKFLVQWSNTVLLRYLIRKLTDILPHLSYYKTFSGKPVSPLSRPLPSSSHPLTSSTVPIPSSNNPLSSHSVPIPSSINPLSSHSVPIPSSNNPLTSFTGPARPSEHRRKAQLDDAARSVVRNIEEGYKRATTKEYIDFIGYSQGSLEEVKGDIIELAQDKFLKTRAGSSLSDLHIDLGQLNKALKGNKPANSKNEPSKFEYHPLEILYPPLNNISGTELTVEQFIELINKTDYLLRKLVESLELKLNNDHKFYQVERARIKGKIKGR
ncbi:MAG: four helix bundle protein [bacterium]|nr:four helix bundle protein [bacterium]